MFIHTCFCIQQDAAMCLVKSSTLAMKSIKSGNKVEFYLQ